MTARIRVLEKSVAERIAAGEVVDRPASVVKELIENSLDAGATRITIDVEGAGSTLIRVSDNGAGIHPDDLPLAVERFATSKVRTADDLLAVNTLGFRGEALPSIAAVSHIEIASAVEDGVGRRLQTTGGQTPSLDRVGIPAGTTVSVRQLFFNTPARRKFLKSASREFALIADVVTRAALAHPAVAFRLVHEGKDVLRYAEGTLADRVAGVLGAEASGKTVALRHESPGVNLTGWVGRPELARAGRRQQYVYVNRRPVSNRVVTAAVEQAYRQLVPEGRFPLFILFVDLPHHRVDINIHPRKMEVRFDDDHRVFASVERVTREALLQAGLVRSIAAVPLLDTVPGAWPRVEGFTLDTESVTAVREERAVPVDGTGPLPAMRLLGQISGTYLLAQSSDGLIIIDQHAAHERVLYERLLRLRAGGASAGQVLVAPLAVELDAWQVPLLEKHRVELEQVGFAVEEFGERTVLLRAVPQIASRSPAALLTDMLAELAEDGVTSGSTTLLERLTISTACHSAIRAGDPLTMDQMVALVQDLAKTEDPYTCFHGRPTLIQVPRSSIERWFLRR
jgi:DNA mismatch repair protein MutL